MRFIKQHLWDILIWGLVGFFTVLYASLIFNINVTTDEIFTLKLLKTDIPGIISGTAADVHPPLYYFYAYIYELISPQNIRLQKIATIIPMTGTLIYVATVVRKRIGDEATFFTLLFFTCVPCTMEYAVQIRMYSLAILCVTVCGASAYIAYSENRIRDWVFFVIGAVGAAYLHYFSFVAVCYEAGLLFLALIYDRFTDRKKDNRLLRWAISIIAMLILYAPWMPYFYRQVTSVRESYWIPPIDAQTIWGYFTWAFDAETFTGFVYVYIFMLVLVGLYGIYLLVKKKETGMIAAFAAMLIPTMTTVSGTLISLRKSPIFCGRYVIVAMMMLALYFGIIFGKLAGKGGVSRIIALAVTAFLLLSGAIQYKECFVQEYRGHYTAQTVEFFDKYLGENDYVVYNYEAMEFVYDYYFPADRLVYVKDFDLDSDYDHVWFLNTYNEWPITELDCMEHNLDMRYLGIYGVEGCAVQLFRIDHK